MRKTGARSPESRWRRSGLAAFAVAAPSARPADRPQEGRNGTGLPVPRYVSLKTDRVNLREGPSKDHRTAWVFQRAGLPVEIIAEYETWRRIRDAEGTEGWVLHSLLSGRRTALITPWDKGEEAPLAASRARRRARRGGGAAAARRDRQRQELQRRLVPGDRGAAGRAGRDGFIRQDRLWGVYPNERVE